MRVARAAQSGRGQASLLLYSKSNSIFHRKLATNAPLNNDQTAAYKMANQLSYGNPNYTWNGTDTAPSKRIMRAYPQYIKTIDGPLVVMDTGLDMIRQHCPHTDDWLRQIEARLLT